MVSISSGVIRVVKAESVNHSNVSLLLSIRFLKSVSLKVPFSYEVTSPPPKSFPRTSLSVGMESALKIVAVLLSTFNCDFTLTVGRGNNLVVYSAFVVTL